MGLLGNGQADVKSIEMNNRAFKKMDLNHVFVCVCVFFCSEKYGVFFVEVLVRFPFFPCFFPLKYSPETFTQAFKPFLVGMFFFSLGGHITTSMAGRCTATTGVLCFFCVLDG